MDSWEGKRGGALQGSSKNWARYSLCDQATPSSNRRALSREHALSECGRARKSRCARHTTLDIAGAKASNEPMRAGQRLTAFWNTDRIRAQRLRDTINREISSSQSESSISLKRFSGLGVELDASCRQFGSGTQAPTI